MQQKTIAKQKVLWYNIKEKCLDIIINKGREIRGMNLKEKTMKNKNFKRNKITMKEVKKQVKGITLIALVVTIALNC